MFEYLALMVGIPLVLAVIDKMGRWIEGGR